MRSGLHRECGTKKGGGVGCDIKRGRGGCGTKKGGHTLPCTDAKPTHYKQTLW